MGGGPGDPGGGGAPRRHPLRQCLGRDLHAVIYLVDITEMPELNTMYKLYDPSTLMFFLRNKHIMIDLGTGNNNNKINWVLKDKQEFIDIVEALYKGARKGCGLVIAPKDFSTKYHN